MVLSRFWTWEKSWEDFGVLEDTFLVGSSYYEGSETLFCSLGLDSPILVLVSCEDLRWG